MKINPKITQQAGFALIVTLSLMILLTVIAVGLLTLSSITVRSTSQGASQSIANNNARLALMLAIGDLQKALGPDQRISATASSFSPTAVAQPNVMGAWTGLGWQGPTGTAPMPNEKAAKFRGWLISTKNVANAIDFSFPTQAQNTDSVWLSNPTTTGTIVPNNTTMRAERIPLTIGTARGGIAWMVSDNSTKAALRTPAKTNIAF